MKTIAPDYYSSFACIKGDCRHSCCAGWEIDIDEYTLEYYRSLSGSIADKLSRCIEKDADGARFMLTERERCPFLTESGLCELILTLGEDSLCQICADHPRFRNFFSDRTEIGLGLCCEAAARLILTRAQPVCFEVIDDDGENEMPDDSEEALLTLRSRLIALMQDRSLPVCKRVHSVASEVGIDLSHINYDAWRDTLLSLERLDDAWDEHLNALSARETDESFLADASWEIAFEQLMVYLLYRHMPAALEDSDVRTQVGCCVLMWMLLRRMTAQMNAPDMERFIELTRLYSSEIEYSDENLAAIADML